MDWETPEPQLSPDHYEGLSTAFHNGRPMSIQVSGGSGYSTADAIHNLIVEFTRDIKKHNTH